MNRCKGKEGLANGKKFTYSDLSKKTGISIATISRVVNKSSLVSDDTRARVLSALAECGVDVSSFEIRSQPDERLIIFNVPSLKNMFYAPIITSARAMAMSKGYNLLVNEDPLTYESLDSFLRLLKSTKAVGLVLANPMTREGVERVASAIPTIMCCEAVPESSVAYVTVDDEGAAYNAVKYLHSLGRRRVAFINGPASFKYAKERNRGYLAALEEAGIACDRTLVGEVGPDMDFETAKAIAINMLNSPDRPDAFFCISDVLACAAEKAALEAGLSVPDDIAIVGFDDVIASHMANPSITTVRQPTTQLGTLATEMVIKQIENNADDIQSLILGTELVIRQSTTLSR